MAEATKIDVLAQRHDLLRVMYRINDCPVDQLVNNREAMEVFTDIFNSVAITDMDPGEVGQELTKLRKMGMLPRLGRNWTGPHYR